MATSIHASYRGAQAAWRWTGCGPEYRSLDAWSLEVARVDWLRPREWSLRRPSRVLVAQGRWAELEDAPVPAPALPVR
eukprot:3130541-Pyramimonas_sp.AAC.1